eukprot:g22887.t1
MIFVNSIFIAIETQWMATNVSEPVPVQVMNYFCSFFFLVELILRMSYKLYSRFGNSPRYGLDFFTRPGSRGWNIFDLCLVLVSFVDVASAFFSRDPTVDVLQAVKILKMLRCLVSALWCSMSRTEIFVFAVWFTTNATFYLREFADTASPTWFEDLGNSTSKNVIDIQRNFGTLHATTYSLLRSMLGGINWGILCDMLLKMDTISPMLFIFYVLFTMLAVLNIVTGVFVDNAAAAAKTQRDYIIEKEKLTYLHGQCILMHMMELPNTVKETYIRELQNLFWQMDDDESGTLTAAEMQQLVKDPLNSGFERMAAGRAAGAAALPVRPVATRGFR